MEETKEPQCLSPIRREDKKRELNDSVQLLVDIGAILDSSAPCLNEYLIELEMSHKDAQKYLKTNPFATARRFLQMHEQRLTAIIKAVKNVLNPPIQYGCFVNNLPDTDGMLARCYPDADMNGPDDNETSGVAESDDGEQSPSHGDSNPSPTPHIEYSNIQYVQLPLPKNQGWNDLNQDRQSGGRGGNHR